MPGSGGSSDPPLAISADELEYERARDVYVARGDVRIARATATLRADWVAFNPRTRQGLASGNVVVVDGPDTLRADFLQFDVDTLEGVVFDGTLTNDETGFRMQGTEVRRTGDETYEVDDGLFTTCRCPDPEDRDPWALTAGSADIDVEGFAVARNAGVEILGVPVAWVPVAAYPLKRERQSGFLLPTLSFGSRSGVRAGLPFFWAARDDVNVVLTPHWTTKRGFLGTAEVDYVIGSERDFGEILGLFVPDDKEVEPGDPEFPFDEDRWGVEFEHVQRLPWWELDLRAEGVFTSDNDVPFDLEEFRPYTGDRFLESVASLSKRFGREGWGSVGAFAAARYADDLQSPDDQDRDAFLLQRLPEAGLTRVSQPLPGASWLLPSMDVRYAYFHYREDPLDELPTAARVDGLFLDTGIDALPNGEERRGLPGDRNGDDFPPGPEGDGVFQEGEPLADKGHRLLVNPRLAAPFRVSWLEVYPEAGYHGTFYETDLQGFEERSLLTGRLDLRTRLRRGYTLPLGLGEGDHLLEPRLSAYGVADLTADDDDPLFVPPTAVPQERVRQLDLDAVLRDPADRIDDGGGVILGLANRFYTRPSEPEGSGPAAGSPVSSRLFADLTASVEYDIDDGDPGWLVVDGTLFPTRRTQIQTLFGYDLDEAQVAEGLLDLRWRSPAGHAIGLRYRFLREIPRFFEDFRRDIDRFDEFEEGFSRINQVRANFRWALATSWALFYRVDFSIEENLLLTNRGGVEYISKCKCWAIQVSVEDDRSRGLQVGLRYTVLGLGDDRARPFQD